MVRPVSSLTRSPVRTAVSRSAWSRRPCHVSRSGEALVAAADEDEVMAFSREALGEGLADARRSSGDECGWCHDADSRHDAREGAVARSARVSATYRLAYSGSLTCFDACIGLPFSL